VSTAVETFASGRPRAWRGLVWGGVLAGVLDITAACVSNYAQRRTPPARVLQSVASGLLGADAYNRGAGSAALGLALHFLIAFAWASLFFAASRRLKFLVRHPVAAGLLYGVVIYLVMYLVVLRVSAFPHAVTFTPFSVTLNLLIHTLLIGLPIALAVRRYSEE
jgi:uncharacterized membrane protein YagU involved in acid resistance